MAPRAVMASSAFGRIALRLMPAAYCSGGDGNVEVELTTDGHDVDYITIGHIERVGNTGCNVDLAGGME